MFYQIGAGGMKIRFGVTEFDEKDIIFFNLLAECLKLIGVFKAPKISQLGPDPPPGIASILISVQIMI